MVFTLVVPQKWNYTPANLMQKYAKSNPRYEYTYDRYFTSVLYDHQAGETYYYDYLDITKNRDRTETVTVFLKEKTL